MFGSAGRANWVAALAASSNAYRSGLDSTATWPSGMRRGRIALDRDDPVDDLQVVRGSIPARRTATRSALAFTARAASATADPDITAALEAKVPTA